LGIFRQILKPKTPRLTEQQTVLAAIHTVALILNTDHALVPSRTVLAGKIPGTQGNLSPSSEIWSLLSLIVCFWRLFNRVIFVVKIRGVSRSEWRHAAETNEERSGAQRRFNHERGILK
jgi:hypothetical protein